MINAPAYLIAHRCKKNHWLIFFIFQVILVLFPVTHGNAQTHVQASGHKTYYLDSTGDDANTGTKKSPWKTLRKINSIHLKSGDTVLLRAGQSFKGTLRVSAGTRGKANRPVLIGSYGKGYAIIDPGDSSAVNISAARYVVVKNLRLMGSGRKNGNAGDGIALVNCSDLIISNLDISGFRDAGLLVYASSGIKITKVNAHDNGFAGISVSGEYQQKKSCHNIYIGYCNAENNPGSPVVLNNHSGNGIIAGDCTSLTIEYCTASNNGWDMPRTGNGPVGIWCYESDSVIIQHCISYRNKTSVGGDDGGGFDLDGGVTNSIIQYCLSYENQGSGYGIFQYAGASAWHDNIMRYNISENDGLVSAARAGIFIWNSSEDSTRFYNCIFFNNTIYNTNGAAINFAGQSERKGFAFYNNIFVAGDSLLKGKSSRDIFLANNWWGLKNKFNIEGVPGLNEWAEKSGQEMIAGKIVGLHTDPGFKNAGDSISCASRLKPFARYKINPRSKLREKGLNLQSLYRINTGNVDFNGKQAPVNGIGASF